MRVLGFDIESSGLDPAKDRIIEFGLALWDTERKAPLLTTGGLVTRSAHDEPLPAEITELTGITQADLLEFGRPLPDHLNNVRTMIRRFKVERIVAHNAAFDRSFLLAAIGDNQDYAPIRDAKWICTMEDLPLPAATSCRKLGHLLADFGIAQPFRHRALFDALGVCLLLQRFPIADVVRRADAPVVVLQALVGFEENKLAKARRYSWDSETKRWLKRLKDFEVEEEEKAAPFKTKRV